jgi:hypothetical protein
MGTFHLALANYIGQAGHPVGMDRTKGREAWNNPVYEYQVTSIRDAGRRGDIEYKELITKINYTWYGTTDRVSQTDLETGERRGHQSRSMSIRYQLELDAEGKIVGGRALSHAGHFLWVPLFAVQAFRIKARRAIRTSTCRRSSPWRASPRCQTSSSNTIES